MIIYTDNTIYAEKIINKPPAWKLLPINMLNSDIRIPAQKLFSTAKIYTCVVDLNGFWKHLFIVKSAPSSQYDILNSICKSNVPLPNGILCLAGEGTGFHGFRNRSWQSIPGNIHLSAFLSPNCDVNNFHVGFVILSAISVIQAIDCIKDLENRASVKWVNDIVISDSKVSGVLANTYTKGKNVTGVVFGIGINVETTPKVPRDPFVPQVASLNDFISKSNLRSQGFVFHKLIQQMALNYNILLDGNYNKLLNFYRTRSIIIGKEVKIFSDPTTGDIEEIIEGKVEKIGENLELFLEGINKPINKGRLLLKT